MMGNERTFQKSFNILTKRSSSYMSLKHMKSLIVLVVGLLAVGCATTPTMKSVAGTYEATIDGDSGNLVLLANGKVKSYDGNCDKDKEGTWKLVEKEVRIEEVDIEEVTDILKIESNGNLTIIALIEDGKRTDFPKEKQNTLKKIK